MSEADLWQKVKAGMGPMWEAERVENRLNTGFPDVFFSIGGVVGPRHGLIELKDVERAPKRLNTVVRIPHFTPEQANFLERHGKRGGNCWMLLRVAGQIMLIPHARVREVGQVGIHRLWQLDVLRWLGVPYWGSLAEHLVQGSDVFGSLP